MQDLNPLSDPIIALQDYLCRFAISTLIFVNSGSPFTRQQAEADVFVERRIRPVGNAFRQPMFYRIPVDIINMPLKIGVISNRMTQTCPERVEGIVVVKADIRHDCQELTAFPMYAARA